MISFTYKTADEVRTRSEMLQCSDVLVRRVSFEIVSQGSKLFGWRVDGWMVANGRPLQQNLTIRSS